MKRTRSSLAMDISDDNFHPHSHLISASKHSRILIWRSEVAQASSQDDAESTYPPPSLTTTTTISTTITTSSSSSFTRSARAALARGRRFLSRITSRIPGRRGRLCHDDCQTTDFTKRPPSRDEPVIHTSMYHMLRPKLHYFDLSPNPNVDIVEEEAAAVAANIVKIEEDLSSRGGKKRSRFMETQARLQWAARLLHHGVV